MATYAAIQAHYRDKYEHTIKSCWIAHVKSDLGLTKRTAANRIDPGRRVHPCPDSKRKGIEEVLRKLGVV